MAATKGKHVWYDLMTTDVPGAKDFYGKVVGWGTMPFVGSPTPYDMWTVEGNPIGGVVELPAEAREAGAPSHWLAYIATTDRDATAARAEELGGTVMIRQDVPDVGKIAVIRDPFGAVFCAFTPAGESPEREGRAQPGDVSWHELMSKDWEKAFDFYSDLFGWEKGTAMDMGDAGTYQLVQVNGSDFGGMMGLPEGMPMSAWMYYVNVADIDAAVERVKENGGQVMMGPMDVPGGDKVAACMDPQGAAFAVHMFAKE